MAFATGGGEAGQLLVGLTAGFVGIEHDRSEEREQYPEHERRGAGDHHGPKCDVTGGDTTGLSGKERQGGKLDGFGDEILANRLEVDRLALGAGRELSWSRRYAGVGGERGDGDGFRCGGERKGGKRNTSTRHTQSHGDRSGDSEGMNPIQ